MSVLELTPLAGENGLVLTCRAENTRRARLSFTTENQIFRSFGCAVPVPSKHSFLPLRGNRIGVSVTEIQLQGCKDHRLFKGTGTRYLIWLKVASLERS